jgi:hypothetical protein
MQVAIDQHTATVFCVRSCECLVVRWRVTVAAFRGGFVKARGSGGGRCDIALNFGEVAHSPCIRLPLCLVVQKHMRAPARRRLFRGGSAQDEEPALPILDT